MPQLFGAKLRYVRRQCGLTQGELAEQLALASYAYINRLEANQRDPALQLVLRIASFFDLPIDYFLRDAIPVETISKTDFKPIQPQKETMTQFGERLRALRVQRGWSQMELARRLQLARQGYVSNLEAGRKLPSLDLAVQVADLFDVTVDNLLRDNTS